jgi:hypothetical protein
MVSLRLVVCEALLVFSTRAKQTAQRNHSSLFLSIKSKKNFKLKQESSNEL